MIVTQGVLLFSSGRAVRVHVPSSVNAPCGAFVFWPSHLVTLSRRCLYIFQSNPPPPLSPSHLENCCITPRQALTGANRARSGYILRATLLYIATCTRFQLCRFESTWLVCVFVFLFLADLWNTFFFQLPRMCEEEEKKKVALHSLLPRFMWVCVCVCARMWECVSIVWCALKRAASRTCKQRKKCGLVCAGVWNKATRLLYKKLTL